MDILNNGYINYIILDSERNDEWKDMTMSESYFLYIITWFIEEKLFEIQIWWWFQINNCI